MISKTAHIIGHQVVAIVAVDGQRIFELHVVEQVEKRIAQREIISVPEKVKSPATVQILLNRNFAVASLDVDITAAPVQIFNGVFGQIVLFVNACRLNRIAIEFCFDFGEIVRVDKEKFFLHIEIVDAVLLKLGNLRQKLFVFVSVYHAHHPF
ncbi:MAG: hypothetical protein IJP68_02640 [Selenomonadaceae bacterium]|nr:hypothetical protein [Selenomonadaceae bacterium]